MAKPKCCADPCQSLSSVCKKRGMEVRVDPEVKGRKNGEAIGNETESASELVLNSKDKRYIDAYTSLQ